MHTYNLLKRIWKNLSSLRRTQFLYLIFFTLCVAFLELCVAGIISLLGIVLTAPQDITTIPLISNLYTSPWIQDIHIDESIKPLILVLLLMVLTNSIKNICAAWLSFKNGTISQSICWDFCQNLFSKYLRASYTWYSQRNTSHLQTYLTWRTSVGIYCSLTLTIFTQLVVAAFLMCGAFYIAPHEMSVFFALALGCASTVYLFTKKKASLCGEQLKTINLEANKISLSALQGLREVQIYNQHSAFEQAYGKFAAPAIYNNTRLLAYPNIPSWVLESAGMALLLLVVLIMYSAGAPLSKLAGTMAMLAAVSWRLLPAMNRVLSSILQLKLYFPQVETMLNDLDMQDTTPTLERIPFAQSLAVQDISFAYAQAKAPALKHISFTINKGQMVGFIGVSGAGKSTLLALLTGLLRPNSGKILVDGKKVATGPGYLKVGYVSQSPYLLDASLAANVSFSEFGAAHNEEKVRQCCQAAAMDFIDELPQGIDTVLGERGLRLSGGQIQRVAIARALYSNPDILIFDEATSALDGATEAAIQKTILSLHKSMTIVIIAHRLSTVEDCDTIHWLKDGTLHLSGTAKAILPEYEAFLRNTAPLTQEQEVKFKPS